MSRLIILSNAAKSLGKSFFNFEIARIPNHENLKTSSELLGSCLVSTRPLRRGRSVDVRLMVSREGFK